MGFKTGDLVKLAHLVGLFQGVTRSFSATEFYPVEVNRWKGQLPKRVVEQRIRRTLGAETCRRAGIETHAWDATGIALWAQGRF
jgi:hypothetical protein